MNITVVSFLHTEIMFSPDGRHRSPSASKADQIYISFMSLLCHIQVILNQEETRASEAIRENF